MRTFIFNHLVFQRYIGLCGISWMVSSCPSHSNQLSAISTVLQPASECTKISRKLGIFSSLDHDPQDKNNFPLLPPWQISRGLFGHRSQQSCTRWTPNALPALLSIPRDDTRGVSSPSRREAEQQSRAGLTWFVVVHGPLSRALRAAGVGVGAFSLRGALGPVPHRLRLLLPVLLHGFHCFHLRGFPLHLKPMARFLLVRFKYFVP